MLPSATLMASRALFVTASLLAASVIVACRHGRTDEGPTTMVPSIASNVEAPGSAGACARLALCCREIYASGSGSGSTARTICGSLVSVGSGGAGSDAACAASLGQVVAIASVSGVVPASCRGPEASVMGGLGALSTRFGSGRSVGYRIPSTVNGTLATGDTADSDGALYDEYRVFLTAGSAVTFVARGGPSRTTPGSNLDMYLVLRQNGVEVTHDDDSAGSLNSRIVFTPTTTGYYEVRVRTFSSGAKEGDYTLQSWSSAMPSAT
ncbi:MAG: PPC domain-containing protein [Deltaproteobacteria bacterium]